MPIELDDILAVEIPQFILLEAEKNAQFMQSKRQSPKYRLLTKEHNKIGFVGHWAVEQVLDRWRIPYETTREEKYSGGDLYDLKIDESRIDVKTSMLGWYNPKYYYNKDFYVLKAQMDDEKSEYVDYYIFVHLERDWSYARIFGVASKQQILDCPIIGPCETPMRLVYENYRIFSRELKPLAKYIFHV